MFVPDRARPAPAVCQGTTVSGGRPRPTSSTPPLHWVIPSCMSPPRPIQPTGTTPAGSVSPLILHHQTLLPCLLRNTPSSNASHRPSEINVQTKPSSPPSSPLRPLQPRPPLPPLPRQRKDKSATEDTPPVRAPRKPSRASCPRTRPRPSPASGSIASGPRRRKSVRPSWRGRRRRRGRSSSWLRQLLVPPLARILRARDDVSFAHDVFFECLSVYCLLVSFFLWFSFCVVSLRDSSSVHAKLSLGQSFGILR